MSSAQISIETNGKYKIQTNLEEETLVPVLPTVESLPPTPPKVVFEDAIPQIIASCFINLVVIQAGVNMAFSAILIPQLSLPESDIKVDLDSASTVASIVTLSIALGALIAGPLMDRYGRKRLAMSICGPFIIAWLMVLFARNIYMIYGARLISGVAGGLTTVALVYVSEISHPEFRGCLLCLNSVFVSLGIFSTYLLSFFFYWRTIGGIFMGLSVMTLMLIALLPESPHWIMAFNKSNEFQKSDSFISMSWFYRKHDIASYYYQQLIDSNKLREETLNSMKNKERDRQDVTKNRQWKQMIPKINIELYKQPQVYKPFIVLFFLFLFQQLSGGYVLIFYTINIFRNLGGKFTENVNENVALLLLGVVRLIMSVVAFASSRRCNRKTLMYLSGMGMSVFTLIAGIILFKTEKLNDAKNFLIFETRNSTSSTLIEVAETTADSSKEVLLLFCILGYVCSCSIGMAVIPWILISEVYPIDVKGKFGGLTVMIAYCLMFCVVKSFPYAMSWISMQGILFIFSLNSFIVCIYVHLFLPETFGKTFSEIEKYFISKKS